jgi:hypothetical protein
MFKEQDTPPHSSRPYAASLSIGIDSANRSSNSALSRILSCWLRELILQIQSNLLGGERAAYDRTKDDVHAQINTSFTSLIWLEVDCQDDCKESVQIPICSGVAKVDINLNNNYMSRSFADKLLQAAGSTKLELSTPYPILEALAGAQNGLIEIHTPWYCEGKSSSVFSWRTMHPQQVQSKFDIVDQLEGCDVVIGHLDSIMLVAKRTLNSLHSKSPPNGKEQTTYVICLVADRNR